MKISGILLFASMLLVSLPLHAQRTADIPGSSDYPSISRFKGSVIEYYNETKWGKYMLPVDDKGKVNFDKARALEGKVIRTQYTTAADNNAEFVLSNYQTAFKEANFKILISIAGEELGFSDRPHTWQDKYYASGGFYNGIGNEKFGFGVQLPFWKKHRAFIAATSNIHGKNVYAIVYIVSDDKYTLITQDIVEVEAPETGHVTVDTISKDIASKGSVAIYDIHFETGQSAIRAGSETVLKNIAGYINSIRNKRFFIVGHTDNTGDFSANMSLSENRAKSVMNELTGKYAVQADRLKAYGVSSLAPVANNSTPEGKAKNRRVEIVEQ